MLFWENRKETLSGLLLDRLTESAHSPKSVDCITVTVYKALSFPTTVSPPKLSERKYHNYRNFKKHPVLKKKRKLNKQKWNRTKINGLT